MRYVVPGWSSGRPPCGNASTLSTFDHAHSGIAIRNTSQSTSSSQTQRSSASGASRGWRRDRRPAWPEAAAGRRRRSLAARVALRGGHHPGGVGLVGSVARPAAAGASHGSRRRTAAALASRRASCTPASPSRGRPADRQPWRRNYRAGPEPSAAHPAVHAPRGAPARRYRV